MLRIHNQRLQAQVPDDQESIVVFLIGMRVNRWWKIHKWWPAARAMPRMIKELEANPELGFLGAEEGFARTTVMVQYWRSKEHLYNYARARDSAHLPAWREFNKRVGNGGDVGIWHEMYDVPRSNIHSLYSNMPAFGLGRVTQLEPARRSGKPRQAELEPSVITSQPAAM